MEICLAFIAFEVGGALKWSKIKKHEKEIISITLLASFFPFILIAAGIFSFGLLFPEILPFDSLTLLLLALLLGALASPTAPAATIAIIHQYKAKGKVTDTILGVAALDDVLGILLFSFTITIIFMFTGGGQIGLFGNPVVSSLYEVTAAICVGTFIGIVIDPLAKFFPIKGEGQWVVIIFALLIFGVGISKALQIDILLSSMTMGMVVVNKCKQQKIVFKILERYTEDLIFLFFFLLSGLHLDLSTILQAAAPIFVFVLLRVTGKIIGANMGARVVGADRLIQKYVAGGLFPQAGIVIGLVLSIYQKERFREISELLLTIIIGATVIHELLGPVAAKYSLMKAKEIKKSDT
jgi:Kef-type K+ transport system membrane component KefB